MKRVLTALLLSCIVLMTLTACQKPVQINELEPPLTERERATPLPDFLTEEQQLLYLRATSLYGHMWSGETSAIDRYPLANGKEPLTTYESEQFGDYRYLVSKGRYQKWEDFKNVVLSVFTESYFEARNHSGDRYPIYRECDGRLCILDASRGGNINYNYNFPDIYELVEKTNDKIRFKVTGHFSEELPIGDETLEDRDKRVASGYEYTRTVEVEMIKVKGDWRFALFENVSDAY